MSGITHVDLNAFALDMRSFIGRAVAAGIEHEKLPPRFDETLLAFLRLRGLSFAQGQRSGIALGKDQLRRGVEMGITCIDMALEERANIDVNVAVDILAAGKFDELYKIGWEMAFARLENVRARAALLVRRRHMAFFPQQRQRVNALANLTPENWSSIDDEGDVVCIDPRSDAFFLDGVEGRVDFLRALPAESVEALCGEDALEFADVLRRVVLALVLERDDLSVDKKIVEQFVARFDQGQLPTTTKAHLMSVLQSQLAQSVDAREVARQIVEEVKEIIAALERAASGGSVEDFFLPVDLFADADVMRAAAGEDMETAWLEDEPQ